MYTELPIHTLYTSRQGMCTSAWNIFTTINYYCASHKMAYTTTQWLSSMSWPWYKDFYTPVIVVNVIVVWPHGTRANLTAESLRVTLAVRTPLFIKHLYQHCISLYIVKHSQVATLLVRKYTKKCVATPSLP